MEQKLALEEGKSLKDIKWIEGWKEGSSIDQDKKVSFMYTEIVLKVRKRGPWTAFMK